MNKKLAVLTVALTFSVVGLALAQNAMVSENEETTNSENTEVMSNETTNNEMLNAEVGNEEAPAPAEGSVSSN